MDRRCELIIQYIDEKINYLENEPVTDGVHNIPINGQVIELLENIKEYVRTFII